MTTMARIMTQTKIGLKITKTKFSWKMTEDKLNYYQSLIYFPKHISIIDNKTSRTDTELKRYVCNVILKEENDETRERNNKKAREKRQKIKEKRLAI